MLVLNFLDVPDVQNEVVVELSSLVSTVDGEMLAGNPQVGDVVALAAAEDNYHPEETYEETAIQQPYNGDQPEAETQGSTLRHFRALRALLKCCMGTHLSPAAA